MFPSATTPLTAHRGLRSRLVRGLDLAVEFATLGEYGVEEVELVTEQPGAGLAWDWPARPAGAACGLARREGTHAAERQGARPSWNRRAGAPPAPAQDCC